jgi:hypothetical protein
MAINPGLTSRNFWRHSPAPCKDEFEEDLRAITFTTEKSLQNSLERFFAIGHIDYRKMEAQMAEYNFTPFIRSAYKGNLASTKVRGGVPLKQTYMYKVFMEYLEEISLKGARTFWPLAETSIAQGQDDSAVAHLLGGLQLGELAAYVFHMCCADVWVQIRESM